MLTTPPAWAVDSLALAEAERAGCRFVLVEERASGRAWCAVLSEFRAHSFVLDRGHGRQVALPLRWWATGFDRGQVLDAATVLVEPPISTVPQPTVRLEQIGLFAVAS